MKLLDQYLYAIKRKLSDKGKDEVIKELESLILDTIENRYGQNPTDEEVKSVIKEFGSPAKIANDYGNPNYVINPEYSDLFFLICKIVTLSLLGAFTIIFVIKLFTEASADINIATEIVSIFSNTIYGAISSLGVVTIIFALISRYVDTDGHKPTEDWSPDNLPEIPIRKEKVSVGESIASIIFILIAISIFNTFPEIVNTPLIYTGDSGFAFSHTIIIDRFLDYLVFINFIWLMEIFYSVATLITGRITMAIRFTKIIITVLAISLFLTMYSDSSLYTGTMDLFGVRLVFLIIVLVGCLEILINFSKLIFRSK